jgi:signal transduction histidine kinase
MARFRFRRYLGIVFIGVVVAPAIVLSILAVRAISHEEAYIEKQIHGTLAAEVAHVSGMVKAELADVQGELDGTVVVPEGRDPSESFALWRERSALVEIPFLLSSDFTILWPVAASRGERASHEKPSEPAGEVSADEVESAFLREQQAFLTDEEKTPVYENIALAYKDDILSDDAGLTQPDTLRVETCLVEPRLRDMDSPTAYEAPTGLEDRASVHSEKAASGPAVRTSKASPAPVEPGALAVEEEKRRPEAAPAPGEEARRQSAVSRFLQSPSVQKKVYDKAEMEGQGIIYRNIETSGDMTEAEASNEPGAPHKKVASPLPEVEVRAKAAAAGAGHDKIEAPADGERLRKSEPSPSKGEPEPGSAAGSAAEAEAAGRIRSMFIAQPLRLSEIVAGGRSGIIPRFVRGRLELLYWRRTTEGAIVGCLIDSAQFKERLIGALPGVYSAVRILTVLDERGRPLIVPPGFEDRDWRRPFVAEEISEVLPRWEIAAYLTDPDVASARAQVATSVMWILILIVFVALTVGGVLVIRSTYAEMHLAHQKTTFVANVSHELKTPLTSIRMFAEMLRDGHQPDSRKQRQYLDIMAAETERLTRLVNNVLDFSKMERGEKRYSMKPVDLVALGASVIESQRARLENAGFRVSFTTRAQTVPIQADEEGIKQAMINLLSNAEKYSTDTKEIDVEVGCEGGRGVIRVSDRGIGIPPTQAGRIFDEFFRVDDKLTARVKGAGLGLTIARRILKDHGGEIRYSAREGGGSTFAILLPRAQEGI